MAVAFFLHYRNDKKIIDRSNGKFDKSKTRYAV